MKVVPHAFYMHPDIEKILIDGDSSIIDKKINAPDIQNQRYLSSHALTVILQRTLHIEKIDGERTKVQKNQMIFLPKGLYVGIMRSCMTRNPQKVDCDLVIYNRSKEKASN